MNNLVRLLALTLALVVVPVAEAKQPRSAAAKSAFVKANPCPATGEHRVPCPGYVVDHIVALCAGGADSPANMQWQAVADAKAKDVFEVRECAALRKQMRQEVD